MSRRIMTTENLEEDVRIENHLRPQLLEDYIGQAKAKEMLKIYIEAAKARGEALDHLLFFTMPLLICHCIEFTFFTSVYLNHYFIWQTDNALMIL